MADTAERTNQITDEQRKRLDEARKDYERTQEEIAPFIRRRRIKRYTTAGQWRDDATDDYHRSDFFGDLKKASRRE